MLSRFGKEFKRLAIAITLPSLWSLFVESANFRRHANNFALTRGDEISRSAIEKIQGDAKEIGDGVGGPAYQSNFSAIEHLREPELRDRVEISIV